MDATQALRELTELSSQIESAVVLGTDGSVLASTTEDAGRSSALARSALELVGAAFELNAQAQEVTRVEVELADGALFVLLEGSRTIAATTGAQPTAGLVVYDLRTCLRSIVEPEPKKKRAARKAKEDAE
jgi:predicted regulator of Ras-like GTPase activity (Roadblock/LC7/MglB family)